MITQTLTQQYPLILLFSLGIVITHLLFNHAFNGSSIRRSTFPQFPGPTGFPIVGCLPFLINRPEIVLDKWAKRFGSLYTFWVGNQRFIVISDPNVVKDLLIKHGDIFSSRKDMYIKSGIILKGRAITATPNNNLWRKHRGIASQWLNKSAVGRYNDQLAHEAKIMLQNLFKMNTSDVDPFFHMSNFLMKNILNIVFSSQVTDLMSNDQFNRIKVLIREFQECTDLMSNAVDFVPFLRMLPNDMTTRAKRLHDGLVETLGMALDEVDSLRRGQEGLATECVAGHLLDTQEKDHHDRLDMVMLCGAFVIPGYGSTALVLRTFARVISEYPEVQRRAHEELDKVVGRHRLPTINDESELRYVRAVIKEVMRRYNPLWLGVPHQGTSDVVYRGHLIPKDTLVVVNTYTMHNNSERYPNPRDFNPERYLNDETLSSQSANNPNPMERDHWTFGAGRRICPGMWLAERELFLAVSHILWGFAIEKVPERQVPLGGHEDGCSPTFHGIRMIPRHDELADVLCFSLP